MGDSWKKDFGTLQAFLENQDVPDEHRDKFEALERLYQFHKSTESHVHELEADVERLQQESKGIVWTRDPIPEEERMGMPNEAHYFFAELHKGDWMLSLRDAWNTGGYKPNTPYWMRSQMIIFPDPPTEEG